MNICILTGGIPYPAEAQIKELYLQHMNSWGFGVLKDTKVRGSL